MAVVPKIRVKVLPQQKLRLRMTPAVPGTPGDDGDAATIAVGSVTTLPAGQPATVANVGTSAAAIFDFGIPAGADGVGTGDMLKATYDPTNINSSAFDRANHTGTQLAATISNFATAADARVSAAIGVTVQAYDADLTAWAGVNPSSYSTTAQIAAAYQPLDSDLTSWAGVTRASGFDTFAGTPSSANLRALLTDESGTGVALFAGTPATNIANTPAGNVAATTVQAAIDELDGDKVNMTGNETVAGIKTFSSNPVVSGGGVQFPATQVPSADANCLDEYEEGTFTPAFSFATNGNLSITYSSQLGWYVKIGKLVTAAITIVTSAFTHTTASGQAQVTGLPFTVLNNGNSQRAGGVQWQGITKANFTDMVPAAEANSTMCTIRASGSGQSIATISAGDMPTGGSVILRFTTVYISET